MRWKLLILVVLVISFYVYPKYQYWAADQAFKYKLKQAEFELKIEKLKADKEAEIARGLEEIVKAKKMHEILFPCYVTISEISKN